MRSTHRAIAGAVAALIALPLAAAVPASAEPGDPVVVERPKKQKKAKKAPAGKPLTVMSRNIYLGGDIFRPLRAAEEASAAGKTGLDLLHAVAVANHETKEIVHKTNFPVRAKLLAREIKRTKPDLIGLQEVALWRSGPFELDKLGQPNATEVDYDFLAILMEELSKRGLKYKAEVVGLRADVEAPAWDATGANQRDERLTMHDVILKRRGSVKILRTGDRIFTENLPVSLAGIDMNFDRGYQWVDARKGKRKFRFINTHLEAAGSDLALAQAREITTKLVKPKQTTLMVCDCNSDPLDSSVKPTDTVPHKAAYEHLTGAGGLTDMWLEKAPARRGWTSGLSEMVNDTSAAGFDHRIDFVFARTPRKQRDLKVRKATMVGNKLSDRNPRTGLWPSDHAGVVIKMPRFNRP